MKRVLLFTFTLFTLSSQAQTWSDDVADIFYAKCAKCHHAGGISSTPLTTFSEVSPLASVIETYVTNDEMPPWPPNNTYQQYSHDRALNSSEKSTILSWISGGALEGNSANTPPVPAFQTGALLGSGDLEVQIPVYMSKALSGSDDYVCFSIPSGLAADRKIKSIEVIPGNLAIVHHALIFVDPDGVEVTDTIGSNCSSPSNAGTYLIAGYTPGASPTTFPAVSPLKLGMTLPAGSNIYFNMHYPAGSYGEYDSTKVIFHFYPENETGIREVYAGAVLENWNFSLPPNQVTTVNDTYGPTTLDLSLLSVFPHQHLLGKTIKAFGITPNQDTLPFIDIPQWDFHWQDFYFYKQIIYAPAGTLVKGTGTYDNTTGNPDNPNTPPITVYPGLNTTDEMFLVYMHYMYHLPGDENYDLEALMSAGLEEIPEINSIISVAPNPFSDETMISFPSIKGDKMSVYIYDVQGNVVTKLFTNFEVSTDNTQINWDGTNSAGVPVHKGVYFVSINLNGQMHVQRIIRN